MNFIEKFLIFLNVAFLVVQLFLMGTLEMPFKVHFFSLFVPVIIVVNLFFFFFWLFNFKWPFLLFILFFLIGYNEWNLFYKFPNNSIPKSGSTFSVMSYNVRLFNKYRWIDKSNISREIEKLIIEESPDILCFQEYSNELAPDLKKYKFRYIYPYASKGEKSTVAIFSKLKIKSKGAIKFNNSTNCGIYIDIIFQNQKLRVYNLHLESFKLNQTDSMTNSSFSKNFKVKFEEVSDRQIEQINLFKRTDKYNEKPSIIAVDLNNTQFSETYKNLSFKKNDAFHTAGSGLGTTYKYSFIPLRIDFLFSDKKLKINSFKVIRKNFSDHYPIVSYYGID
jgi:endonuclease/exonuclease/phosphatase family metal-dependent hydrolase